MQDECIQLHRNSNRLKWSQNSSGVQGNGPLLMDHLREIVCVGEEADLAQAAADGGADDAE